MTWRRASIEAAGISLDQHPLWPTLDGERLVYQRFSDEGTVSVHWGMDATIDETLAHVGLGSWDSTRTVEQDQTITVDGAPAHRVRLRVTAPPAVAIAMTPQQPPSDPERIFVLVGFEVNGTSVLLSYRSPASELAEVAPLLEHILASVRRL